MAQMTVSLSDGLKDWADARVSEGRYASTSAYVSDLMRRDQEHQAKRRALQAAIDDGIASGVSERDPFDYLSELRGGLRTAGKTDAA